MQTALDAGAPAAAALGMLVTGLLLAAIGWQLPAVASGLAGGATLSEFGAFVACYASRSAVKALGTLMGAGRGLSAWRLYLRWRWYAAGIVNGSRWTGTGLPARSNGTSPQPG